MNVLETRPTKAKANQISTFQRAMVSRHTSTRQKVRARATRAKAMGVYAVNSEYDWNDKYSHFGHDSSTPPCYVQAACLGMSPDQRTGWHCHAVQAPSVNDWLVATAKKNQQAQKEPVNKSSPDQPFKSNGVPEQIEVNGVMFTKITSNGLDSIDKYIDSVLEPEFYVVPSGKKWERMKVKLDTGAVDWVLRQDAASAFELTPSLASSMGIPFFGANGSEIQSFGQRQIAGISGDWGPLAAKVNVADVRSNLAGGMPMIEADNKIVLDKSDSYILSKRTGQKIRINHEGGAFTFDFWVPAPNRHGKSAGKSTSKNGKVTSGQFDTLRDTDAQEDDDVEMNAFFVGLDDLHR